MIKEISSFWKLLENFVLDLIQKNTQRIDMYVVKEINEETFTANIKHPNFKNLEFDDVPISSIGLGNFKGGVMKLPSENDYVLVTFLGGNLEEPIIIGTMFNNNDNGRTAIPQIKENELFLNNKSKGSYIIFKANNDITLRSCDSSGNKKAVITIDSDGNITLNEGSMSVARVGDDVEVIGTTEPGGSGPHTHGVNIVATIITGNDTVKA